jgi:hypothetical protein
MGEPATGRCSEDKVTLGATIKDQGGGVGMVEWRVNGTTLGVEERGLARIENLGASDRSVNASRTLALKPDSPRPILEGLFEGRADLLRNGTITLCPLFRERL